jgi:peptide/nickel transport system substrate-binding protein
MPQRIDHAEVTVQTGLPIKKTLDWVRLVFTPIIEIPMDAWSDWDAVNQRFIMTGEKHPGGTTAKVKSVVTYPADLFETVTWHDGSRLTIGDFVMNMIIATDRANRRSPLFDSDADNIFESEVKAVRIVSQDPLVIETYSDEWQLDAENIVNPWWPEGDDGPLPWHTTALASTLEEDGVPAFSNLKAQHHRIEQINYLNGPALSLMSDALSDLTDEIPYNNTLSGYITPEEATSRWDNLRDWYASEGHFWVGTGPFYVDEVDWDGKQLVLMRFLDFPDAAGRWDKFSAKPIFFLKIIFHSFRFTIPINFREWVLPQ